MHKGVLFATLHIVGSNNNFEARDPKAAAEFFERDAANVQWIQAAYAAAAQQNARAIVFAMQADVFDGKEPAEEFASSSGFRRNIGATLLPLAAEWKKPVLLIHGDSHVLKLDQPFRHDKKPLRNVTRLEVPGANDVRAVRVSVSEDVTQPFAFELFGAP
jgi:NAD(P)-dependent dehydrogenase (short-subunit alcohol dehydrogenase family)